MGWLRDNAIARFARPCPAGRSGRDPAEGRSDPLLPGPATRRLAVRTAWHACWPPHWRSTAFRWRHCQPNDGYRDVTEGITVHLCHRWQSRPRRRLDHAALPLSVSNLRPREREPGTDGRDRPIRCGGPPVPGTYDDAAREASRQAAANRWLHESPRRVRHRWWRPRRRVVRRLIGPAVSWRSLRKMRPIRTLLSGWWAFVGTSWKLRIVRT